MKPNKPYLSLSKKTTKYELEVIVASLKDQTITGIRQEEVICGNDTCWGVVITLSDATQLVNGPENPIYSATVDIALDKSVSYKRILVSTQISLSDGKLGPAAGEDSSINFEDGD